MHDGAAAAFRPPQAPSGGWRSVAALLVALLSGCLPRPAQVGGTVGSGAGAALDPQRPAAVANRPSPPVASGASARPGVRVPKARPIRLAGAGDMAALRVLMSRARTTPAGTGRAEVRFAWPVAGWVVSAFGRQPNGHRNDGIDIASAARTTVRAAASGTILYAGSGVAGYGTMVMVGHRGGYTTIYAHTRDLLVGAGDLVAQGQPIADPMSGEDGRARLHFQLRSAGVPIDPVPFLPPAEAVVASVLHRAE